MKKKSNIIIISLSILILIALMIFALPNFIGQQVLQQCTGGSTITSISNANIAYNEQLGKDVVRVTATINGRGECARIIFDKEEINRQLEDNGDSERMTREKILDIILEEEKQTWSIQDTDRNMDALRYIDIGTFLICSIENCRSRQATTFYHNRFGLTGRCLCEYTIPYGGDGSYGEFTSTSDKDFKVRFKLQDGGEVTMNSETETSVTIGSRIFAKWTGNSFGRTFLEKPNYDAFRTISTWALVSENADTRILVRLNEAKDEINRFGAGVNLDDINQRYNDYVNLELRDKTNEFITSNPPVKSARFEGANFIVEYKDIFYPTMTIDIDAAFVGIQIVTGKPKAICPTSQEIESGNRKNVNLIARNEGNNHGSFDLRLLCNDVSQLISPSNANIAPSQQITAIGTLTRPNEGAINIIESCRFLVKDVNDPSAKDECSFSLTIKPNRCTPGQTVCSRDGNAILSCNLLGTYDKQDCPVGQRCRETENGAVCGSEPGNGDCKAIWSFLGIKVIPSFVEGCLGTIDQIKYILALLAGIISIFVTMALLAKFKIIKNKGTQFLIGLIIGFLFYVFILKTLIIGLIIFVAYTFIKSFISKFPK